MDTFTNISKEEQQKDYSISEIYFIIQKHRIKIISTLCLVLLVTIYCTLVVKPVYKSSGVVMVSDEQGSMSIFDMGLNQDLNYIENEIEILKSRSTSELVVKKLFKSDFRNNLFIFDTQKFIPTTLRNILTLGIVNQFQRINNFEVDDLTDSLLNEYSTELRNALTVSNIRNTDAIIISYSSNSPIESSLIVNSVIDVYKQRDLEWTTGEMSHLKQFLLEQLDSKEIELSEIEENLKEFQEKEKIFSVDDNSKLLFENLTNYEVEYNNVLASIKILNERQNYINKQLTDDEKKLSKKVSNTINDRLFALKNELTLTETELISVVSQQRGENHDAVSHLKEKIKKLKSTIEDETRILIQKGISVADPISFRQSLMDSAITIKAQYANLVSKSLEYKKLVESYDKKLSDLPEKVLEFVRLERVRTIHAETYSFMRQKLEEARIGEASKLGKIRVIDMAIPNEDPISPNKLTNLLFGGFIGICLGLFVAFIFEVLDNTIKSIEQIERRGLSILSIIPSIGNENNKSKGKKIYLKNDKNVAKLQRRLITQENPKSPVSEAYRGLRTSLMYTEIKEKCKMILVSSPGPGEGKTTTIANLSITYANLGKKTLLVDSDLRKPVLHNVFKIDKTPGLTSYLTENSNIDDIINKTNIENLDIITSGVIPPNPSELLDSDKMKTFIEFIKENYDVVLFDSPPLIAVTDAYVVLKHVEKFVLVVRFGITERGGLNRVLASLNQSKIKVTGAVLNAISEQNSYGAGYYYNYYQYYYGEEKK